MINEFREDLVSGEWVLLATGRAKRGGAIQEQEKIKQSKGDCPFEDLEKSGNVVVETYPNKDNSDWFAKAVKNKFPAVLEGISGPIRTEGPFKVIDGNGRHEIIVFREHDKTFAEMSEEELTDVFRIYRNRYESMFDHGKTKYVLLFHNQGLKAGATVQHPHSQIMSIPILPPDVRRSINGSEKFYNENKRKVYDDMIAWELQMKSRIIYESDDFVAFCPFVSRMPYEIRVFPKVGHAHFEQMPAELLPCLGKTMRAVFRKLSKALNDPDFNFFIHTAPLESTHAHDFYTWHIEILPQMTMLGGFDLGTGVEVNVTDPDDAAKLFRETKID
jgi:UDPglucose--hexose-1-phosphate uridylyltransferase